MLEKLNRFTKKVADLQDRPNTQMSAAELKEWFDAAPEELRVFINKTLVQIDKDFALKQELNDIVLGQIVDGSLTDIKMSNDQGQIKDRLAQQINELTNFKKEKGQPGGLATLLSDGYLEQKPYVTGTFVGDGTTGRLINIGKTPKAVMITTNMGNLVSNGNYHYFAFALTGSPMNVRLYNRTETMAAIATNGFNVSHNSQYDGTTYTGTSNNSGTTYHYIAFF